MTPATQAAFDAQGVDLRSMPDRAGAAAPTRFEVRLSIHNDIAELETEWRAFERVADCTAFQTFDWVSAWCRHVGIHRSMTPAIVAGRDAAGALLFILPLAVETGGMVRRLTWLASDLCDYNGPLLAPDFSRRIDAARFEALWCELVQRLQSHPSYRYDMIHLEKMPEKVGAQANPLLAFPAMLNPSNAYLTGLGADWESFYAAKRSSSTRRRDRTKRKRLGEFGDVRLVNPDSAADVAASFEILMQQKTNQFARMGVPNIFARRGYPEFFREIARLSGFTHISRLDIGALPAAANLGLIFRGRYYHVLASYTDAEPAKFGPGAAHLHDLMAHAIKQGCDTFDFTIGDERYKRDWCDSELKLYDHITLATARGAVVAGPLLAMRSVKRWIKQTPAIWNAVSKVRAMAGSLRRKPADQKAED